MAGTTAALLRAQTHSPASLVYHYLKSALDSQCRFEAAEAQSLVLENGKTEIKDLPTIARTLVDIAARQGELGEDDAVQKEAMTWIGKVGGAHFSPSEEAAKELEEHIVKVQYIAGPQQTIADIAAFANVHALITTLPDEFRLKCPSIYRYFDMLQHKSHIAKAAMDAGFTNLPIKVDPNYPISLTKQATSEPKKQAIKKAEAPAVSAAPSGTAPKLTDEKPQKKAKAEQSKETKKTAAPATKEEPVPSMIDLRVGYIKEVKKHPDADTLYVETIDVGEAEPRTVVSGLVNHMPPEALLNHHVILVCNLKPVAMRGVKSYAMVLCASDANGKVELCVPPSEAKAGDRAEFEGFEGKTPEEVLNPKKKIWESIQPNFTSLNSGVIAWTSGGEAKKLLVNGVPVVAPSIIGGNIR